MLSLDSFATTFGFSPLTSTLIVVNSDRVDFDTRRSYELVATATDATDSSLTSTAVVTINLIDYNDLSPVIHNDGLVLVMCMHIIIMYNQFSPCLLVGTLQFLK